MSPARAFAFAALLATGAALAAPVQVGSRSIEVPAPAGYVAIAQDAPKFLEISQGYLPASNRLVEIYVDAQDQAAFREQRAPAMERYLQLQVGRETEGKIISPTGFEQASGLLERELEKAMAKIDDTAGTLAEQGNQRLKDSTGSDARLSFGGVEYQGAYRREPWGLFFTIESQVTVTGSDIAGDEGGTVVTAGAMMLANHQMLFLYAFAQDGDGAREWARQAVSDWADAVRAANPDDPALAAEAVDLAGHTNLFRYGGMVAGAVAGILVALAILAARRMKHS